MKSFFQGYIQETYDTVGELITKLKLEQESRHIYLFGCGGIGVLVLDFMKRNCIKPYAFCANDSNFVGSKIRGLQVVSFSDMVTDQSKIIILSTLTNVYIKEMIEQLNKHGIFEYHYAFGFSLYDRRKKDIHDFSEHYNELEQTYNLLKDELSKKVFCASINAKINGTLIADRTLISDKPIFLDDVIHFNENEVYLDIGAFIGDNALRFLNIVPNAKVYSFEPDPVNYNLAIERTKNNPEIIIYPYGCGETQQTQLFTLRNCPNTTLISQAQSGNQSKESIFECEIVKLDDYKQLLPTFISMDIEGGELSALKGASKIIRTFKPKMAIAIYHNAKDFWMIPEFVLSVNPEYKFFVRTSHLGGESCVAYFL